MAPLLSPSTARSFVAPAGGGRRWRAAHAPIAVSALLARRAAPPRAAAMPAGHGGDADMSSRNLVAESIAAAESACIDEPSAAECAQAWEAALDARLNAADAEASASGAAGASPAAVALPSNFKGGQARGMPDPLMGLRPAELSGGMQGPTGSLRARGALERAARDAKAASDEAARRSAEAVPPEALEARVQEAKAACETGSAVDCAVAWDEVEELSATRDKKKLAPPDAP